MPGERSPTVDLDDDALIQSSFDNSNFSIIPTDIAGLEKKNSASY